MASKLLLVLALMVASAYSQSFLSQSRLYSAVSGGGASLLLNQQYANTLTQHGFDNTARSFHVVGVWVFYEDDNFNSVRDAGVEFGIGFSPAGYLGNFDYLSGRVSSARFVGVAHDYRIPTFTLFEYTWFQGVEQYATSDLASVSIPNSGSFIVTGKDAWTIYDRPNYQGNAFCVYPPSGSDYTPGMVPDTEDPAAPVFIPHGAIKSIRKGCVGKRVAGAESPEVVHIAAPALRHGSNAGVESVRPPALLRMPETFFVKPEAQE